jgi:hypothetical protein
VVFSRPDQTQKALEAGIFGSKYPWYVETEEGRDPQLRIQTLQSSFYCVIDIDVSKLFKKHK